MKVKRYLNGTTATSAFCFSLDGRALRFMSHPQKACIGAEVLAEPGRFHPSMAKLAEMLRVPPRYIAVARAMSPAERAAILAGHDTTSFTPLVNGPKSPLALPAPKKANGIDDAKLQAAVRSVGVERVLDALVAVEQAP